MVGFNEPWENQGIVLKKARAAAKGVREGFRGGEYRLREMTKF